MGLLMAHAFTQLERITQGKEAGVRGTLSISSYTSGGETLTASEVGLNRIDRVEFPGAGADGRVLAWDRVNSKVMVFEQDAGGALGQASGDLSATVYEIKVFGRP